VAYSLITTPLTDNPAHASSSSHTQRGLFHLLEEWVVTTYTRNFALDGTLVSPDIGNTNFDSFTP